MINAQEEAIRALVDQAKTAAHRTYLIPEVTSDITDAPPGLLWIRTDEQRAYLKTSTQTLLVGGVGEPGGTGGGVLSDRSVPAYKLMLNSITVDEMGPNSVGASELGEGAVTGDSFADIISAETSLTLTASQVTAPALTVDVDFNHNSDIMRVLFDGDQRVRVDRTHFSIGEDLTGSAVSIQTDLTDPVLRLRGSGGAILAEKQNGALIFRVDASGNATFAGAVSSLSGDGNVAGSQAIQGALTVTDQVNFLDGLQVAGRTDLLGEVDVDGRITMHAEPYLPADYAAKFGSAVHARTVAGKENRLVLEGVDAVGVAELQLGTGGPVLRGELANNGKLYVNGDPVLTGAVGGLTGSQMARDTVTGASGPGVGNIAAETITGYNIKNGSITSTELSPGAVVAGALAAGSVGPVALADGSVIDRVVASLGVGKLISGTLNADEVFMGPSGHIYLGPTYASEINGERIQIDASGIRAYNAFNTPLAEFTPGGFTLRTGVDGARMQFDAATGLELFGLTGQRTGYLSPLGEFQLASVSDGASMRLNSGDGILFTAAATKNLAYNPGFIGGSEFQAPVGAEAVDDQRHVFAGEYAVRFRSTNPNVTAPSYVDVPLKNTVGTGQSIVQTRVNYCTNPCAEVNASGWLTLAPTNQVGSYGSALGFIRNRAVWATATAAGEGFIQAPTNSTSSGFQWAASASVRVSSAQSVTASIIWYNVNNTIVRTDVSTPFALKTNVVTQVGLVATAPSGSTSFRLQITATLNNTDRLEVGNILYERASGIGSFFDGFSEGFQWDGTPGLSTSSKMPVAVLDSQNNLLSVYVWSDVPAWGRIEGWDGTSGTSRGASLATRLLPNQWSRIAAPCTGRFDRIRLHYPATDPARQTRITATPVWFSGVQVESDRTVASPFCAGNEPGCRWEGLEGKSASIRDRDVVVTQISPSLGTTVSGAIVGGSLTSASFFAGRIFGTEITGGTITGAILRGNLITGDQILAGTINATALTSRSITADLIAVNSLTGDLIKANSITGDKVSANTLTGTNISGRSITGDKFVAGTISATEISARAVTADKLQADLVLSSRIIAGASATGARVEMAAGTGLVAYRSDGVRTFLLEAATGRAFFMGQLSSASSGSRIDINPGGVNPDTIRFYPWNNDASFASIDAVSWGSGTIAGIRIVGSGSGSTANRGMLVVRDQYASLVHGRQDLSYWGSEVWVEPAFTRNKSAAVDLVIDQRLTAEQGPRRIALINYDTSGTPIPSGHLQYMHAADNRPWLWGVNQSCGIKFDANQIAITSGDSQSFGSIKAASFPVSSSEQVKADVGALTIPNGRTSWDLIEGAPVFEWAYRWERARAPYPTNPDGSPVMTQVLNPDVENAADLPDQDPEKFVWRRTEWEHDEPDRPRHRFPLAEDLAALDSKLVVLGVRPEDSSVDLRDMIGILWDAVDKLIKRTRDLEAVIAAGSRKVPARPQRGDVVDGIGSVIPGRSKRPRRRPEDPTAPAAPDSPGGTP